MPTSPQCPTFQKRYRLRQYNGVGHQRLPNLEELDQNVPLAASHQGNNVPFKSSDWNHANNVLLAGQNLPLGSPIDDTQLFYSRYS